VTIQQTSKSGDEVTARLAVTDLTDNRIAILELRLRRQSFVIGMLVLILLPCAFLGAAPGVFVEIQARRFIVTDEKDNPRALLTSRDGTTTVSLFDSSGQARARFAVLNDGHPEVSLLDAAGQQKIRISETNGSVQIQATGIEGQGNILIGQTGTQFGIDVSQSSGNAGVKLRSDPNSPQVAALGGDGNGVVQVFAHGDKSGVSISDPNGQPGVILTMLENLRPLLLLQGQQKRTIVVPQEVMPPRAAGTTASPSMP
jgi:hypothetical protein